MIFWEPDAKTNTARAETVQGVVVTVRGGHHAQPIVAGSAVCYCGERMVRIKAGGHGLATLWHLADSTPDCRISP